MPRRFVSLALATVVLVVVPALPATAAPTPTPKPFVASEGGPEEGVAELDEPVGGTDAVQLLGEDLDDIADFHGMAPDELTELLTTDETVLVGTDGTLFFQDEAPAAPRADATAEAAAWPLDQTFALHSSPGAERTIFIDFDGATVTGTSWNVESPGMPTEYAAWDPAGDGPVFSDVELADVQAVWESVAEDYAPFDVDVTTEDPGADGILRSSESDDTYGAHAVVTSGETEGTACQTCGGIARFQVFDKILGAGGSEYGYGYDQPAWIFAKNIVNVPQVADIVSHEVGHQIGLLHDDMEWSPGDYYVGHAGWVPIMGMGFTQPISQWSKGDYTVAENREDDLAIARAVLGQRADEAPAGIAGSPRPTDGLAYITDRTDVDTFRLGTCQGDVSVTAAGISRTNLDIALTLRNAAGAVMATADPPSSATSAIPATGMDATVTATLPPGAYFASVDGVGRGTWADGYDDYGSLGGYALSVSGDCTYDGTPGSPGGVSAVPAGPTSISVSWSPVPPESGAAVTGYRLTRTGTAETVDVPASETSFTWDGLTPGTAYTFTVAAGNEAGFGSPTSAAGRIATVPGAVRGLSVTWRPLESALRVAMSRPADDGGSPITHYEIHLDGVLLQTTPLTFLSIAVPPGTHSIGVAAVNAVGRGPMEDRVVQVPVRPTNDEFATRQVLTGSSGTISGDNAAATLGADDPVPPSAYDAGAASVWYSWTAPADGWVLMYTGAAVTTRDTTLAAYTGTGPGALTQVAGNDDIGTRDTLSLIQFVAVAGVTYTIVVDGFPRINGSGLGAFTLTWEGPAPVVAATETDLAVVSAGRSAALTATVQSADPSRPPVGSVEFREGSTVVGTSPVANGVAALVLTGVALGTRTYTATFVPSTADHAGSTSIPRQLTVRMASRVTLLLPDTVRHPLPPVAVIAVTTDTGRLATGKVTVAYGGRTTTVNLTVGLAVVLLNGLGVGTHTVTVTYQGNAGTDSSTATQQVTVRR